VLNDSVITVKNTPSKGCEKLAKFVFLPPFHPTRKPSRIGIQEFTLQKETSDAMIILKKDRLVPERPESLEHFFTEFDMQDKIELHASHSSRSNVSAACGDLKVLVV
jgi:hypothetical protein